MRLLADLKSWAKGVLLLALSLQPIYSEETQSDKNFAKKEIEASIDMSWEEFIESRISGQGREGEIKEQLKILTCPYEKIPLMEELIELKWTSFKKQGGSLENFLQGAANRVENNDLSFSPFEGALGELQAEIFALHSLLGLTTAETKLKSSYYSPHAFPLPFLRLFDFEQKTGLGLYRIFPLMQELKNCSKLISSLKLRAMAKMDEWWKPYWDSPEMAAEYHWGPQFVLLKRLTEYVSSGPYPGLKEPVLRAVMDGYFNPNLAKWLSPKDDTCDPLVRLLPKIIRFVPVEDFKKYFQERFSSLDPWEIEGRLMDLHFLKIEALAAVDQNLALEQIRQTEKEIDANLWAYPFSWNYTAWQSKRAKALESLAMWKAKLLLDVE